MSSPRIEVHCRQCGLIYTMQRDRTTRWNGLCHYCSTKRGKLVGRALDINPSSRATHKGGKHVNTQVRTQ